MASFHPRRSSRLAHIPSSSAPNPSSCSIATTAPPTNPPLPVLPSTTTTTLLSLSPELRLQVYPHLLVYGRPYMVGRCQEKKKAGSPKRKCNGSPRDIFTFRPTKIKPPLRDDRMHRPIQPPITRVCRIIREEAMPTFYSENEFWLIHNEFQSDGHDVATAAAVDDDEQQPRLPQSHRNFHPWLYQTPCLVFSYLTRLSLCGYTTWPNRYKIDINLHVSSRAILSVRHYSTYGDEMPIYRPEEVDELKEWFVGTATASKAEGGKKQGEEAFEALQALLNKCDWMFQIPRERINAPPGMLSGVPPAEGMEYDF